MKTADLIRPGIGGEAFGNGYRAGGHRRGGAGNFHHAETAGCRGMLITRKKTQVGDVDAVVQAGLKERGPFRG